jgi:hypothetical protein
MIAFSDCLNHRLNGLKDCTYPRGELAGNKKNNNSESGILQILKFTNSDPDAHFIYLLW